jgi:hypothetical protein
VTQASLAGALLRPLVLAIGAATLLTGCGLLIFATAASVGVVGATGYAVYEGGKGAVSVTGSAASGVADAAKSTVNRPEKTEIGEVVFRESAVEAVCPVGVPTVTAAARVACRNLRFYGITSGGDALKATVTCQAGDNEVVTITVEAISAEESRATVMYGEKGDLRKSELIMAEMARILEQG